MFEICSEYLQGFLLEAQSRDPYCNGMTLRVQCTNKYTARHIISVPAGNGQAGRAPDSRETILSLSPDRRHFYYYNILFNLLYTQYICHALYSCFSFVIYSLQNGIKYSMLLTLPEVMYNTYRIVHKAILFCYIFTYFISEL